MKLGEASKGHLIVGGVLVIISLAIAIVLLATQLGTIGVISALGFGVFFFGVWGGVEVGRFIESKFESGKKEDSL